jgi:hypothetical protein
VTHFLTHYTSRERTETQISHLAGPINCMRLVDPHKGTSASWLWKVHQRHPLFPPSSPKFPIGIKFTTKSADFYIFSIYFYIFSIYFIYFPIYFIYFPYILYIFHIFYIFSICFLDIFFIFSLYFILKPKRSVVAVLDVLVANTRYNVLPKHTQWNQWDFVSILPLLSIWTSCGWVILSRFVPEKLRINARSALC